MNIISKIEIQYFRSIYRITISELRDLNIFTGKNDVGKSNVLKALNLFFNNCIYDGGGFDFQEIFNKIRAEEVRRDSIKGKQFIQIKITFLRGKSMEKTLPPQFTVAKKWLRYDEFPIVTDDLEAQCTKHGLKYNDRTKSSLTKYLKAIKFIYIPAIKDANIFGRVLSLLQETLYNEKLTGDKELVGSLERLSDKVQSAATELNQEFFTQTGISANISSPKDITEFYSTLSIDTTYATRFNIKLDNCGDGIRVRYLPSILNYLALNIKKNLIWGFEEPENSVEYNLAINMANSFAYEYAKNSMILLTSHSPAFINLENENTQLYRCFNEEAKTEIYTAKKAEERTSIAIELGYLKLQEILYKEYIRRKEELDLANKELSDLRSKLKTYTTPVVLTEGKTDVTILKRAWEMLYPDKLRSFEIESCDTVGDGSGAGCNVLRDYLISHKPLSDNIIIGIFDRDNEGIKAFELSRNFTMHSSGLYKISKNGKTFACLLPQLASREEFIRYKTFCIEYMFDDIYLTKRVEGKGLVIKPGVIVEKFNGSEVKKEERTELWFSAIDPSTKTHFAENIVPTFPAEAFENFKALFDIILEILAI